MAKLDDLVDDLGITIKSGYLGRDKEDKWEFDRWRVKLGLNGRSYTTEFRMGTGHGGKEPTAASVLSGLVLDADVGGSPTFEDFADDLGYDRDSREAERIYKKCKAMRPKFLKFLGRYEEVIREAAQEY